MKTKNILVIGAGGLGSEVIKLLKLMNCNITILDYDIIEISNLNRQFYYQTENIGKPKAQVIAEKTDSQYLLKDLKELNPYELDSYDIIFSCLDNISSRMDLNYIFFKSNCKILIDCGVESMKLHVKKVTKSTSCLYCIKDLYRTNNEPFLCSLKGSIKTITPENRDQILNSLIFKMKEDIKVENSNELCEKIVKEFNMKASDDLKTTFFEVIGILKNIIPNVCTINAICASLAVLLAFRDDINDFIYVDGTNDVILDSLIIEKDPDCFICNIKQ